MQKYAISAPQKESAIRQNQRKIPAFMGAEFPHSLGRVVIWTCPGFVPVF
jgi:hypothetical protein